jgi:hypothetical protein
VLPLDEKKAQILFSTYRKKYALPYKDFPNSKRDSDAKDPK